MKRGGNKKVPGKVLTKQLSSPMIPPFISPEVVEN